MSQIIALIGGTGPEGRGLATRFALAGHEVIIGSRDAVRGENVAAELRAALSDHSGLGELRGEANAEAVAAAEIVVVTVPYEGHRATLSDLAGSLAGKVVVDAVVPVRFDQGPRPIEVQAGSATEEAAELLPNSHVIGAFHNLAAETLLDPGEVVDCDVLVTGSDEDAKSMVCILAEEIEGVRAVDAGPLRYSRFVEGLTILLIGINIRNKARTHVQISGLQE
jgi:NADPH-dependent F420 reductase